MTILVSGMFTTHIASTAANVINARMCPSTNTSPRELASALLDQPTTLFIFVTLLALSAAVRAWCYRSLGNQFRFQVSIQERHRLVTSGPYAFVRHPSYLAMYGVYIGSTGVLASRGTWSRECVLQAPAAAIVSALEGHGELGALLEYPFAEYVMLALLGAVLGTFVGAERGLRGRLVWEEEVLKKEFGKEWDEYARHVRWRVLPFVF